tara:strand:- start:7457 stop:8104 length:648 start_codon:yes stop_codon:yes gene_type:complete
MPNHIIGKENLPNVYIDNIVIKNNSIIATLCMYDQGSGATWFNNRYMSDMKVHLIATSNLDVINQINLSGSGIMDFDNDFLVHSERISIIDFYQSDASEVVEKYEYICEFEINQPTYGNPLLNLYVCSMVNIDFFNNPQLDRYSGAVTGEKIFEAQKVPAESGYFYYPDTNEEYPGPVHFHDEEYMEASIHTSNPHKIVRYVPETNAKIKDERSI